MKNFNTYVQNKHEIKNANTVRFRKIQYNTCVRNYFFYLMFEYFDLFNAERF